MPRFAAGAVAGLALVLSDFAGAASCAAAAARAPEPPAVDAAAGAPAAMPADTTAAARPTLVVFITVDQLRTDYLTSRFGAQLTGGLKRLRDGGALFVDAHHDHAISETAPGHASTLSGRFPMHTGIVRNAAGVQDPQAPLLAGGSGGPASPARFRGTRSSTGCTRPTRAAAPCPCRARTAAPSSPSGRSKQQVYWWGGTSGFTTSAYYADSLPDWSGG
jgi:hypothetical protein